MSADPLKVAVIGTGHLGSIHARVYSELDGAELVAVVDTDPARAALIAEKHDATAETDYTAVLDRVDAVSIATPTVAHFEVAKAFLQAGVPVLVEKPITTTVEQGQELVDLAKSKNLALQVGHSERFNPAIIATFDRVRGARFIEAHRLAPFRFRSVDIGVILDLMIHDLDIILAVTGSEVVDVQAAGVNIISPKDEDIANARLTFANGCVANITASRISRTPMRKLRFFTPDSYMTVDMMKREAHSYRKSPEFASFDPTTAEAADIEDPLFFVYNNLLKVEKVDIDDGEPLKLELGAFLDSVRTGAAPVVSGEDGLRAIRVAFDILRTVRATLRQQAKSAEIDLPLD
jgi:predicted dehydrogenase